MLCLREESKGFAIQGVNEHTANARRRQSEKLTASHGGAAYQSRLGSEQWSRQNDPFRSWGIATIVTRSRLKANKSCRSSWVPLSRVLAVRCRLRRDCLTQQDLCETTSRNAEENPSVH